MCGLNAIYAYHDAASPPERRELLATRDAMRARGPDGAGEWWSEDRRLGLGHRRLAIQDLSDRASQPMASACGRYVVVFNGEIYNFPAIRRALENDGVRFRTTSDTEALLHLYEREGEKMLARLRGMFAFALWDDMERTLFLARDPYGIKPLYVAHDGWSVRVASQVKALLAGGRVSRDPDPAGQAGFWLWGSVPEPFTLYRDIRALPAGHWQVIDENGPQAPVAFASVCGLFAAGAQSPAPADEIDARVRAAASDSVAAHLLADVEVGVFLSAGVDSGALLALMRDAGQARIRAITLRFEEFAGTPEDEAPLAMAMARRYDAEHIVRTVSHAEYRADLPLILEAMDQPSIDGVNTWFVAKAAREAGLKVALSGVGGDELLAGYPSFRDIPRWVDALRWTRFAPGLGGAAYAVCDLLGAFKGRPKMRGLLAHGGEETGAYLLHRGLFLPEELPALMDPARARLALRRLQTKARLRGLLRPRAPSVVSRVAALESAQYLRNQLLRDTDWAGMAHSLEIRTPLVDYDLLMALSTVTPRLTEGRGKRALAAAPSAPLPAEILERGKTGFTVPTGRWAAHQAGADGMAGLPPSPARELSAPTREAERSSASAGGSKGLASRAWARRVLQSALGAPQTEVRGTARTPELIA